MIPRPVYGHGLVFICTGYDAPMLLAIRPTGKGNVILTGRKSERTLYNPEVATFEAGGDYRQADAEGFIRINALRLRLRALAQK